MRPALIGCLLVACLNNSVLLFTSAAARTITMQRQAADLHALPPCETIAASIRMERGPLVMPVETSPGFITCVDRYGDPSAWLPVVDQADFDRARANLLKPGCS